MKFNKKQKEIIIKIVSGEIQDIYSYMSAFNLLSFVLMQLKNILMNVKKLEFILI